MKAGGIAEPSGNDQDAPTTGRSQGQDRSRLSIIRRMVGGLRFGARVETPTTGERRQFMFTALGSHAVIMRTSGHPSSEAASQCVL